MSWPSNRSRIGCSRTSRSSSETSSAPRLVPKVSLDPLLEDVQPALLEPLRLGGGERLESQVRQRSAAPDGERLTELAAGGAFFEAVEVELLRLDCEHEAVGSAQDPVRPEQLPEA